MQDLHEVRILATNLAGLGGEVAKHVEVVAGSFAEPELPDLRDRLFLFRDQGGEALVARHLLPPPLERPSRDVVALRQNVEIRVPPGLGDEARRLLLRQPDVLFVVLPLAVGLSAPTLPRSRRRP